MRIVKVKKRFSLLEQKARPLSDSIMQQELNKQSLIAKQFRLRLQQISERCRELQIEPVLLHNPACLEIPQTM